MVVMVMVVFGIFQDIREEEEEGYNFSSFLLKKKPSSGNK
jgi:hypothetical protein